MKDDNKTKEQLINELGEIRQRVAELETSEDEHRRVEVELEKEQEQLRIILESISDGVAVTDMEPRITDINEAGVRMFGYNQKEEIIGRSGIELISPKDYARAMVDMRSTLEKGHSGTLEYTFLAKDGKEFLAEYAVAVIRSESGSPAGFVATMKDITERKKAEGKHQIITRTALDGFCLCDIRGRFLEVNNSYCEMIGYTQEELLKMSIQDVEAVESSEDTALHIEKIMSQGYNRFESRHKCKDGEIIDVEVSVNYLNIGDLEEGQFFIFIRDITERKRIEEDLRESEEKFRIASQIASDVVYERDLQTGIATFYGDIDSHLGYELGEYPRTMEGWREQVHPEDLVWFDRQSLDRIEPGAPYSVEYRMRRKDGTYMTWWDRIMVIRDDKTGMPVRFIGAATDITERKRAEEALREAELKYRIVADNTYDWEWWLSPAGEFTYVSPSCSHITGYNASEFRNNAGLFQNIIHPDDLHVWDNHRCETSQDKVATTIEFRILHKDGSEHWIEHICQPVFDDTGKFQGSRGSNRDITERRQAEELFRNLANSSPIGIYIIQDGGFKYVNSQFQKQTGYSEVELLGLEPMTIVVPEDRVKVREHAIRMLKGNSSDSYEYRAIDKAGNTQWVLETVAPIMYNEKRAVVGNQMVITERKQLEAERQRVEKLESIGTLAAGIAHDFNNLLTGIMGNISLAKRHIESEGKALERLEEAEKASIRARDLTQQLLTFTRGGVPVRKIISIGQLILESANFALRGSNVRPKFSLPDDLWMVEADEGQINQVINNIVINADQAMPQGGTINIKVKNQVITSRAALPLPNGNYVEISIKDQGVGILKEHLDRIFDPFFTTKQKGSGLGLATAYSIINNHGGYITVESKLGVGTKLCIYLPASKVKTPIEEKTISETPLVGKGRILVMDDEESIQKLLHAELTEAGYDVDLTHDGTEAIKQYKRAKEAGQPFDLVILDLTIPGGVGGKETIKKLLEINPKVKAIVSSGYATDPIISEYKKYGFSSMVPKPYSVSQLEKTIQDLLKK